MVGAAPLRHWGWLDLQNSARAAVGLNELLWDADRKQPFPAPLPPPPQPLRRRAAVLPPVSCSQVSCLPCQTLGPVPSPPLRPLPCNAMAAGALRCCMCSTCALSPLLRSCRCGQDPGQRPRGAGVRGSAGGQGAGRGTEHCTEAGRPRIQEQRCREPLGGPGGRLQVQQVLKEGGGELHDTALAGLQCLFSGTAMHVRSCNQGY